MNKKYLAVLMAGATVATSVAPVFAAEENTVTKETITVKEAGSLIKEVENLLKIKYNGDGETVAPVYEIKAGNEVITKSDDLKKMINDIPNNAQLVVTIKDKGHAKDADGKYVSKAVGSYKTYADLSGEVQNIKTANEVAENREGIYSIANVSAELKKSTTDKDILSITLESKANESKKTINLNIGDNKVNLKAKPLDKDGKEIELKNELDLSTIVAFADADPEAIPDKDIKEVTVKNGELAIVDSSDIYDGFRLSAKGVEIAKDKDKLIGEISEKDEQTGKYSYVVKYIDASGNPIELTVESTSKTNLEKSKNALAKNEVKVNVVAGEDRYSTAIEIAKESGLNDNIVIVNSNKIVDGLAATPFAKMKSAPIVLASDTEVPQVTLDYIKSVIKTKPSANIYIVGGESAVSKEAEKQLTNITKNVERISGDDRHTTSLEVAKAMTETNPATKAYVVGAKGEPDAMSIAAKAAEGNSPIIVNGWSGLSNESMTMLKDKEIDIIGGSNNVSNSLENDLKLVAKDSKVERVEGETRHDTNAKVIEKYYDKIDTLYVAKDGYGNNNMLIDALAAGPLAAGNGPILLATDQITDSQENSIKAKEVKPSNVIQIGNGIKTAVYTKLASILGW
ncbi:cell wall-binding repeat-containing protein [Clostridioides mangenotii]|uniref:cell wall-binding repeat-containing protein n=1 Tax=Metaclostridioides mangenotii TaxID=1540 RepID=UPI001C12017B|nr:cell wall-binding repeat-containing protein [Clostridioides mangenotii]MBU5306861.1 cell wall-binding repeat-containing protein [Clostridioides mangenotii]